MSNQPQINIRALETHEEMVALYNIHKEVWANVPELIVEVPLLDAFARHGGVLLGAFQGEKLVGGAVSFLGAAELDDSRLAMANLKLHSQGVTVLETHRDLGIAYHLKLAQYQFCSERGIRLMTWMFDPLDSVSAHVALRKLGVMIAQFKPMYLGADVDYKLPGSPDRLLADWWLTHSRTLQRLKQERAPLTIEQYLEGNTPILNASRLNDKNLPVPPDDYAMPSGALAMIEIPARFDRIVKADPTLAQQWREHVRGMLSVILTEGFILTDFLHTSYKGRMRSFYVASLESSLRQINQN